MKVKKRMKAVLCVILMVCLMGGMLPVHAASGRTQVYVDERVVTFDVSPIARNGRTLVAISLVCSRIGADLAWDGPTQTVTIKRAATTIELTIGSTTAFVNGVPHTLDVAPVIIRDRTMMPLRFIMEQFNQKVEWDEENNSIYITEDTSFLTEESDMTPWILGCNAIIAYRNRQGPNAATWWNRGVNWRRTLENSWGCYNREDLLATIAYMTDNGQSSMFDEDADFFRELAANDEYDLFLSIFTSEKDAYMSKMVIDYDQKWGEKSIKAWDWFRMTHLIYWGYMSGYLEFREVHELAKPIADRLKATFSSWDEATENYMDGYLYWSQGDPANPGGEYTLRVKSYETMKAEQEQRGLLFDPKVWE